MKDPGARTKSSVKNVKNLIEKNKIFPVKKRLLIFHSLARSCSLIVSRIKRERATCFTSKV